jgi:V/A-type H+-transporting ATPase subunit I
MIVAMKELWLFVPASSAETDIRRLGELGVVELKGLQQADSAFLDRCKHRLQRSKQALEILEQQPENPGEVSSPDESSTRDPERLVNRILIARNVMEQARATLEVLHKQLDWYQTWGESVNLEDFKHLSERGIYLRLYWIDQKSYPELAENHCLIPFKERNGQIPVALVSRDAEEQLDYREVLLPELSYPVLQHNITSKNRQLEKAKTYLAEQQSTRPILEDYQHYLHDILQVEETRESMGAIEDKVKYLKGYLPKDKVDDFVALAGEQQWGYQIKEPEEPDEVPVYIKNPRWISLINPVMKFIGIVPGYKEVDVSIYFLVAFALFFAMLVGDAGYGALFLLMGILFRKRLPGQLRLLIYVLSGATVVWGVLSGTYFGSEAIAGIPFLNALIVEEVASFGSDNVAFMMHLSFLIGAIHLTVAHGVRFVQFINSLKCLSELGWIALIWGLFFLTELLVLGKPAPGWYSWLFIGGVLLVSLFSRTKKTLLSSMLASLSGLPLSLINGFSDIVSYVRLFAVGLATAAVAASFNNIIIPEGGFAGMGFLQLLGAALALLLGHGLNIALALMAVLVHGIRLNMLEFSSHLGVQFSGRAYQPFRLNARKKDQE